MFKKALLLSLLLGSTSVLAVPSSQILPKTIFIKSNQIMGISDASSATAGRIGEILTSSVASADAVTLSTGVRADVVTLNITPGSWLVVGEIKFRGVTVTGNSLYASIGNTSGNVTTNITDGVNDFELTPLVFANSTVQATGLVIHMVNVSANTTYYLKAKSVHTSGTVKAFGSIRTIRIR